ncbi:ABC transporter permease [Nocardioides carbamazepini]|uniref:ABC transporter permease n=1 Tax=Nocardioides carbamazepini TaxID=2854259 RepID=UPI00214A7283|nr:ABC transporter permease [Nocardioides carbamazepini]MCR1784926.1 ABC transporter permease [Nocardioides carbamazepini]
MSTYLQFAVFGLSLGVLYAALANGLIMVYRATGIINFAMGAMAMWGGYVYAFLRKESVLYLPVGQVYFPDDPGFWLSLILALASSVLVSALVYFLAFRPVRQAPVLAQVVVSIAVMLTLQALALIRFGGDTVRVDRFLAADADAWKIGGVTIEPQTVWFTVIVVVLSALLWAYLRFTRQGMATRAAASNERAAILMGYSPSRLAAIAMILAGLIATVAVLLTAPTTGLNPVSYTLYVVPALAVMLVAKMSSIGVATGFGIALGAFQSILAYLVTQSWWPEWAASGVDQVVPLMIVMIALLAFGNKLPARGSLQTMRLPDVDIPRIRPVSATVVFVVAAALLALSQDEWRFGLTTSLIMTVLALSYVIVTGYLGQISLVQVAFAGTSGFVLSKFGQDVGIPFPIVVVVCALTAVVVGLVVALPALRIRGAQLAIVTLTAALAIERFVFNNYSLTPAEGNNIGAPQLFGLDFGIRQGPDVSRLAFSWMVLVVVAVMVLVFVRVASGDLGRAFLAVRANERAAASAGIDVRMTKMTGFALSAFFAGVAGCLIGYSHGQLSASSFTVFVGLQILAVAYLGGITSWGGAVVAGMLAPLGLVHTVIDHFWTTGNTYALVAGLLLILTAILNPSGIAGATKHQIAFVRAHRGRRQPGAVAETAAEIDANANRERTTSV